MINNNLTKGSILKTMIMFALPYLLACFLQSFYGMADLFVVGLYNGSATTTAVAVGSQVTHMLTVMIVGLAMGVTVKIGQAVGAGDKKIIGSILGTATIFFAIFAIVTTVIAIFATDFLTNIMMTPVEAVSETKNYLYICFAGIPFITAYNVISAIFRGAGDSKRPMYFVCIACIVNVVLDFVFVGYFKMGALGAALATVFGQGISVVISLVVMKKEKMFELNLSDFKLKGNILSPVLKVGVPISMQDGLIQISFILITVIANSRGLIMATSVGIVEKLISFMFLVPSAFLSAISAVTAQNIGAGKIDRARKSLYIGICITVMWGVLCFAYSNIVPQSLVGLFTKDGDVLSAGCEYLRAYSIDVIFASIHFCFSGYFCGSQKSIISFIHNILAVVLVRVPGAYLASVFFPATLYPMGLAAPLGSLLSSFICIGFYMYYYNKREKVYI